MFYIRFTVLALTTAQLEIWWLLNTEFSQYITVIETPVLNNSKRNHWQFNSNKPWSCLTCYNLGKGYSPGGRQAGGFKEGRFLISGWFFIVALLQHIFATWFTRHFFCHFTLNFFFTKAMPWVYLEVWLVAMNIGNLFSYVATLKYTCCNQQRITSKSYSALGRLMRRWDSTPDLLVQKLSWRWWQQPRTLLAAHKLRVQRENRDWCSLQDPSG